MLLLLLSFIIVIIISMVLLALYNRCLGMGLMAGLQVGQALGVILLPGFGVGSSILQIPGHQTSMCDSGIKGSLTFCSIK